MRVEPSSTECFYEMLKNTEQFSVSFNVEGNEGHTIDFHVTNPVGQIIHTDTNKQYGYHAVVADREGRYTYCFSNHQNMVTPKMVYFYPHNAEAEQERYKKKQEAYGGGGVSTDPMENEIKRLSENLQDVREHLDFMAHRKDRHQLTAESTNERVKWWSLFQLALLVASAFFQVNYLRKIFSTKRVV